MPHSARYRITYHQGIVLGNVTSGFTTSYSCLDDGKIFTKNVWERFREKCGRISRKCYCKLCSLQDLTKWYSVLNESYYIQLPWVKISEKLLRLIFRNIVLNINWCGIFFKFNNFLILFFMHWQSQLKSCLLDAHEKHKANK